MHGQITGMERANIVAKDHQLYTKPCASPRALTEACSREPEARSGKSKQWQKKELGTAKRNSGQQKERADLDPPQESIRGIP